MAKKLSKNVVKARALVEPRPYTLIDAVPLLQKAKYAKFDETVDLTMRLGVDPKHADQMVRGTVVLPHGLGKSKIVAVIASGDKIKDAEAAGAEFFGGEELVEKIQKEGWTAFDALIATPDMMRSVGRLGKVLGPRGLMPNPKTGTVTSDVVSAIREIKAGKVEFRTDKTALVHVPGRQALLRSAEADRQRHDGDLERAEGQAFCCQRASMSRALPSARRWAPAFSWIRPLPKPRARRKATASFYWAGRHSRFSRHLRRNFKLAA